MSRAAPVTGLVVAECTEGAPHPPPFQRHGSDLVAGCTSAAGWSKHPASQPAALRWPSAPMHVQKASQHLSWAATLSANEPQSNHNSMQLPVCYRLLIHSLLVCTHAQHRAHSGAAWQQPQDAWCSTAQHTSGSACVCRMCQGPHFHLRPLESYPYMGLCACCARGLCNVAHPPEGGCSTCRAGTASHMGLYLW